MGRRGPQKDSVYMPTSPERRAAFLRALRESGGSFAAACRATAPHLSGDSANAPAYSTWRALMQRDPTFAAAVEETLQVVRDDIEAEMHRRSVVGVEVPQYQKAMRIFEPVLDENGQPVRDESGNPMMRAASIRKYSDALLLARARALMPERYGEKKTVDINHTVNRSGAWTVTAMDLEVLNATEQEQLASIMAKVRDHRKGLASIEHKPAEILDADFSEVEDDAWDSENEPIAY